MRLKFCAVCGSKEDLQYHHFIPKVNGGLDINENILTLCYMHHLQIHSKNYYHKINHSELTKQGLKKARQRGIKLGNPKLSEMNKIKKRTAKKYAYEHKDLFLSLKREGKTHRQICNILMEMGIKTRCNCEKWNPSQVTRILRRIDNGMIL